MRVVLFSVGTLGDVHPFVAVALALRDVGFDPVLAASDAYRPIAERHGLTFHPVRPATSQVLQDTGMNEAAIARAVAQRPSFVMERVILPYVGEALADLQGVVAGASLVLTGTFGFVARIAAEAAGVPHVSLLLQPMALFSADDPPVTGEAAFLPLVRRRFGPAAVRPFLVLARAASRRAQRPIGRLRRQAGTPAFTGDEIIDGPIRASKVFGLYSPTLAPPPADAPAGFEAVGFSFYDGGHTGAGVSRELMRFLESGPPPVVFTLGSIAVYSARSFYEASAAAAVRIGVRAVLLVGEEQEASARALAGPSMFVAGYAPHSALFPRARAVVHHGGVGTVAQALRAGVPQLVCPGFGDQFDNAARLERLGVALSLRQSRYDPASAAVALTRLTGGAGFAAQARGLQPALLAEDGASVVASSLQTQLTPAV